jgi:hypothetical protein
MRNCGRLYLCSVDTLKACLQCWGARTRSKQSWWAELYFGGCIQPKRPLSYDAEVNEPKWRSYSCLTFVRSRNINVCSAA